jgi:transcriptional regulator with XRE-family HTH domain
MTGREFFGRRLRIAREQQAPKLSRHAVGERVQVSDSAVAAWESGRNIPDAKTLRAIERILGTNGLLEDIVDNIVAGDKSGKNMGKWTDAEAQASMFLRFSFDVIPGLLQIEEYARAILRDDEQVKARMDRQKIMAKEEPPVLVALIDESVLHRNVGGPAVMRDQLHHLGEMATHAHVIVQVIKMSSPVGAQYTSPFIVAIHNGQPEIAYTDDAISGDVVGNSDDVSKLRRMFEMLRKHALSEEESIRLIRKAAEAWTSLI